MKTIAHERFIFHKLYQNEKERTSDWIDRLRIQAEYCNFSNDEERIFDQVIGNTLIKELRESAFKNEKMTLKELLELARKIEKEVRCHRCGHSDHFANDEKCPAKRSACNYCGVMGHFERECFKRKRNSVPESSSSSKRARFNDDSDRKTPESSSRADKLPRKMPTEVRDMPCGSSSSSPRRDPKTMSCYIGEVLTNVIISDEYANVNVMSKKFFDSRDIKCTIHKNKEQKINKLTFSKALETRVDKNGKHIDAEFYISKEIEDDMCVITTHIAKKIAPK